MSLHDSRTPRWKVELLDSSDRPIGNLINRVSGSVTLSATDRLGGSAELSLGKGDAERIDWQRDRCRISYDPGTGDAPWDVATLLFSSPAYHNDLAPSWDVTLQTKMAIIAEDSVSGSYVVPAGSNLVQTAVDLVMSTGETRVVVTPSAASNSMDIVFPQGENLLTVVNTLLQAANYWGLYTDGSGQFVFAPYLNPASRAVVWEFQKGDKALHRTQWARTQDQASVPNRVETYTMGTEDSPPIIGTAENANPNNPYSIQARGGRRIVRREQVEAASQQEADALAERFLLSAMSPLGKLEVEHAVLPIAPREVVRFQADGIDTLATVQSMTIPLTYDSQVRAAWNEVQDA